MYVDITAGGEKRTISEREEGYDENDDDDGDTAADNDHL